MNIVPADFSISCSTEDICISNIQIKVPALSSPISGEKKKMPFL